MPCINCGKVTCPDGSLSASVGGCDCPLTVRVMSYLGAKYAAYMHAKELAGEAPEEWSVQQWLQHFEEEETFFFPIAAILQPDTIRVLIGDHELFRYELGRFGVIRSKELLKRHSAAEDEIAKMLLDRGIG